MHHAQRRIARRHVVHRDTHRAQIVEFVETDLLALHLPPDAVDVLRPAADLGADAVFGQGLLQAGDHRGDVALAPGALLVQLGGDLLVDLRLQVPECQVLQLPLELPDAQPVRQRRMDVAGEPRQRLALGLGQRACRAHAGQLAGQQDRHHPQVAYDRQQQPAQAFGVDAALLLGVQGPHLGRGGLAFAQIRQRGGHAGAAPHRGLQGRHRVQQRGQHHVAIGGQGRQRIQRVCGHAHRIGHAGIGAVLRGRFGERMPQRRRQRLQRRPLQQRGDVVNGGDHGRKGPRPSAAGMTTLPASRPQEQP